MTKQFDITDEGIEKYHAIRGEVAPRVTLKDIEDSIESIIYFTALDGYTNSKTDECQELPHDHKLDMHLFCVIMLKCGFTVTGENICVSRANYNRKMGEQMAHQQAIDKLWPMFGFELARKLHCEKIA